MRVDFENYRAQRSFEENIKMKTLDGKQHRARTISKSLKVPRRENYTAPVPSHQLPPMPNFGTVMKPSNHGLLSYVPKTHLDVNKYEESNVAHWDHDRMNPQHYGIGSDITKTTEVTHPDARSRQAHIEHHGFNPNPSGIVGRIHYNQAKNGYHVEHAEGNSVRPVRALYPSHEAAMGGLMAEQAGHARGLRKFPAPKRLE